MSSDVRRTTIEDRLRAMHELCNDVPVLAEIDRASPKKTGHSADAAIAELENFVRAERYDRDAFADDTAFVDWVLSRARHTLATLAEPDRTRPPEAARSPDAGTDQYSPLADADLDAIAEAEEAAAIFPTLASPSPDLRGRTVQDVRIEIREYADAMETNASAKSKGPDRQQLRRWQRALEKFAAQPPAAPATTGARAEAVAFDVEFEDGHRDLYYADQFDEVSEEESHGPIGNKATLYTTPPEVTHGAAIGGDAASVVYGAVFAAMIDGGAHVTQARLSAERFAERARATASTRPE